MLYVLVAAALFALILGYFELAKKYNIVDKPNERSSHKGVVIRGGGIVFVFGVLFSMFKIDIVPWFFLIGFLLVSAVSFIDDRISLGTKPRMLAQFIGVFLLLAQLNYLDLPIWVMPIIAVLCVAALNAYNFMDGINGINGLYSLSVLISVFWLNFQLKIIDIEPVLFLMISVVVFGFFNFRKKAKCFSGDIGSVAMAFALIYLILNLVLQTKDYSFILFLLLYGLDAFWTVVQRVKRKEKITEPHRLHLYQLLSNERKMPHLLVASAYAIFQFIVSFVIVENHILKVLDPLLMSGSLIVIGSVGYILLKWQVMRAIKFSNV